jgi:hypothetical protein
MVGTRGEEAASVLEQQKNHPVRREYSEFVASWTDL